MIFRKAYTMPIPPGAEIFEHDGRRVARWRLRNGQIRSAEVVDCQDGKLRVRGQSKLYLARYRDGRGEVVEVATGCRDEVAARAVLGQLERRAELIRAGVMTLGEAEAANHAVLPLSKHLAVYEGYLRAKEGDPRRVSMLKRRLERLARDCRFTRLNKMSAGPVERWLVEQAEAGLSASTRNCYREALVCFGNWCRRTRRLTHNPFADLPRADQNADRRHQRRALTEEELMRLLQAARWRPLAELGREVSRKTSDPMRSPRSRATWKREPLTIENLAQAVDRAREALRDNPDLIARLERIGRERALIFKTLVLTGLRKGELASLTVAQLELDGPLVYAVLDAADEKNRRGSSVPLRADLAVELSTWLEEKLTASQAEAQRQGRPIPMRLPASTPLFHVPSGLSRILDRDLAAAGISKRDERNRVVDVHALRVTFGTHLCAAGVPLRTAQAAMRHSKPELTANIYTDPKLLDLAGAMNALPSLMPRPEDAAVTGTRVRPRKRYRATS
jgi:integrase